MRIKNVVLSLATIAIIAGVNGPAAFGQSEANEPKTATLLARRTVEGRDNYVDAAFSFQHGVNGEEGRKITRNDWDLLFGNSAEDDTFDVTMVTDDCSRIKDLGEMNWGAPYRVRSLAAYLKPTREPSVKAVVGHMYLVHTADQDTDLYTLFRVEALEHGKSVTISWKIIPSPDEKKVSP